MPEKNIKIEDIKNLYQQINEINLISIKNVNHDLSQRIETFLDQTKNIPEDKLKNSLTSELSKLVQEIEEEYGPIMDDRSPIKEVVQNYAQTVKRVLSQI